MTSAATSRHSGGSRDEYETGRGAGLVIFASVVLAVLGFFNLLDGIAAISNLGTMRSAQWASAG